MREVGLHNIAEELQDHWEVVAGREQRMQREGLGCGRSEVQRSMQY